VEWDTSPQLSCLLDRVCRIKATATCSMQHAEKRSQCRSASPAQTVNFGGGQASQAAKTKCCSDIHTACHSETVLNSLSHKKPTPNPAPMLLGRPALLPGEEESLRSAGLTKCTRAMSLGTGNRQS